MKEEAEILKMTAHLWDAILQLPVIHPSDNDEFMRDIHNIQNRIAAREYFKKID